MYGKKKRRGTSRAGEPLAPELLEVLLDGDIALAFAKLTARGLTCEEADQALEPEALARVWRTHGDAVQAEARRRGISPCWNGHAFNPLPPEEDPRRILYDPTWRPKDEQ